jgi:glycosyltransferase involved in cell wall biosynthesis
MTNQSSVTVESGGSSKSSSRRRLRIAYVTSRDSSDRRSWSGTLYNMGQALERHCGVVSRISPLQPFSAKFQKLISHGFRRLTGRTYLYTHTASLAKKTARMAERRLSGHYDVIFAPVGSGLVAHLQTSVPIVYLSDATFRLMLGYNWEFTGMLPSQERAADEVERRAMMKASELVFPSSWAARSAVDDYQADPSRVNVVPFGANLDPAPTREKALRPLSMDKCRLLFVGVNWPHKGGEIALETLIDLERSGISAELTVVGCTPPHQHPNLKVFPFLNKNNRDERQLLDKLYSEADFFLLPTRSECFSIALCEANAFGIPILSTETGGLSDLVREGINGYLFPLDARGNQYAARIREVYSNASRYQRLRRSSREEFETRLNWDAWGERMRTILWKAVDRSAVQQAPHNEFSVPNQNALGASHAIDNDID